MFLHLKNHFLQSVLEDPEYLRIHSKHFLQDTCQKYDIDKTISPDGYVYCKIEHDMNGLKQTARLAKD